MIETLRQTMLFVRNVGLILADKAMLGRKKKFLVLISYLKLKFNKNQEMFLGHTLNYFDWKTTVALIESIFIENEYYFKSETDHPKILDLGSNIGLSLIYFKYLYPKSEILAFEPDPKTFRELRKNVGSFKYDQVKTFNLAVINKKGVVDFYVDKGGPGSPLMSIDPKRLAKNKIRVRSDVVSSYIKGTIDLLKMDIEGAEMMVLKEMEKTGKLELVNQMIVEYHHHINSNKDEISEFFSLLERNGFGYQIRAAQNTPFELGSFEDVHVHAYKRSLMRL